MLTYALIKIDHLPLINYALIISISLIIIIIF